MLSLCLEWRLFRVACYGELVSGMRNVSPCIFIFNFAITEGEVRPNWAWMEQIDLNKQLVFWGLQCDRINEAFIGRLGAHWWMWMEIDFYKERNCFHFISIHGITKITPSFQRYTFSSELFFFHETNDDGVNSWWRWIGLFLMISIFFFCNWKWLWRLVLLNFHPPSKRARKNLS